jgi:Flp pilus assembly protein TadD
MYHGNTFLKLFTDFVHRFEETMRVFLILLMLISFSPAVTGAQSIGLFVGPQVVSSGAHDNSSPFSPPPNNDPVLAPKLQKGLELAVKELKAGKYEEARAEFEKLYAISPGNPSVNFWLGLSLLALNKLDDASNYLNRSNSLSPHHARTLAVLGLLEINRANYQGAIAQLEP